MFHSINKGSLLDANYLEVELKNSKVASTGVGVSILLQIGRLRRRDFSKESAHFLG